MHPIPGHGTGNPMADRPEANKPFGQEHTVSGNAAIRYSRLFHRHCTSLDLETAFKKINISHDIELELCQECKAKKYICPAFTPGMLCSSVSSMPTNINIDEEEIPNWWRIHHCESSTLQCRRLQMKKPTEKWLRFVVHQCIIR